MNEKVYLSEQLEFFIKKLERAENFSLIRFGDGEVDIMKGRTYVSHVDGWQYKGGKNRELSILLRALLDIKDSRFFYGIPCPYYHTEGYFELAKAIDCSQVTFANLFFNINYRPLSVVLKLRIREALLLQWSEKLFQHNRNNAYMM